jgi:hypothetical protein
MRDRRCQANNPGLNSIWEEKCDDKISAAAIKKRLKLKSFSFFFSALGAYANFKTPIVGF